MIFAFIFSLELSALCKHDVHDMYFVSEIMLAEKVAMIFTVHAHSKSLRE
jgi:hypothetical protein